MSDVTSFDKLDVILELINAKNTPEALRLIAQLSQTQIEEKSLNYKTCTILELVIMEGDLEAANAIIKRYALVTKNNDLKPLSFNFKLEVDETNKLKVGMKLNSIYLESYKQLITNQKNIYIKEISAATKELRIAGLERLLSETVEENAKKTFSAELEKYRAEQGAVTEQLLDAIKNAKISLTPAKEKQAYKKAIACIDTAAQLDEEIRNFSEENYKFEDFKSIAIKKLNTHKKTLETSRGIGETLAKIGNLIMRYSGVGLAAAVVSGNRAGFFKGTWQMFSEKTKSLRDQEHVEAKIELASQHSRSR